MWELNYNIHDLLTLKIRGVGSADLTKNLRYSYFHTTDSPDDPDLTLNIGPFRPSHDGAESIAHRYYVKENYFYCKDRGSKSKWELEIFGFETGKTVINFHGKKHGPTGFLFPTFMAQELLIPFIEYKLAANNHYLIHGGAVCKENSGFVLTGRPGVWKTSLLMDLMRTNEYQFLGDDRIILNKDGTILCFPISQFLFDFALTNTATEERTILSNIKLLYDVLMKNTEKNPIHPITKCNTLKSIIFVSRKNSQNIETRVITPQEGLEKLLINNQAEYIESTKKSPVGQYNNYIQVYSLIFPDNALVKHNQRMREGLKKLIFKTPMREILLPGNYER